MANSSRWNVVGKLCVCDGWCEQSQICLCDSLLSSEPLPSEKMVQKD